VQQIIKAYEASAARDPRSTGTAEGAVRSAALDKSGSAR